MQHSIIITAYHNSVSRIKSFYFSLLTFVIHFDKEETRFGELRIRRLCCYIIITIQGDSELNVRTSPGLRVPPPPHDSKSLDFN